MVSGLLLRGMIAGCLAGLLAASFAAVAAEPSIDRAIAFEEAIAQASGALPEPELVSRQIQRGLGLFAASMIHGGALGGLFGLAFALLYGRVEAGDPRVLALLLAGAGFLAIALVPGLKYPANPPAVASPETIRLRTLLYVAMVLSSVLGLVLAAMARPVLGRRLGTWNASLAAAGLFIAAGALAGALLPPVDEIPPEFPAGVLWTFRLAALGTQAVLWSTLGLIFGAMVQIFPERRAGPLRRAPW